MDRLNKLDVFYYDRPVGTMALHRNRLAVAQGIGLPIAKARKIALTVRDCVFEMLGDYL